MPTKVVPISGEESNLIDQLANDLLKATTKKDHSRSWGSEQSLKQASYLLFVFQVGVLVLFYNFKSSLESNLVENGAGTAAYNMFIGIEIMMFIGFGYLMTFMKLYGLGAVGFTMMICAVGIQWYIFVDSFWHQVWTTNAEGESWHNIPISIYTLMDCLFGISAVLISFGGLIGKINPFQLLVLALLELTGHAFNYRILMQGIMKLQDGGGTYVDHMFGAYFGLAVAWVLGPPRGSGPDMGAVADVFSFIGTLFLWVYWPSFVAGAAEPDSALQQIALVNTILALSASTVSAFLYSSVAAHDWKFRPVDIQNATLAGGVAIGSIANYHLDPFSAVATGTAAGLISAWGYNYFQPKLECGFLKLHDSCGIHNLHGMPSLVGGFASVIVAGYQQAGSRNHGEDLFGENTAEKQWWYQLVAIPICVGFAVGSGLITGFLLKYCCADQASPRKSTPPPAQEGDEESQHVPSDNDLLPRQFRDDEYWEVAPDYQQQVSPYNQELIRFVAAAIVRASRGEGGNNPTLLFAATTTNTDTTFVAADMKPAQNAEIKKIETAKSGGIKNISSANLEFNNVEDFEDQSANTTKINYHSQQGRANQWIPPG